VRAARELLDARVLAGYVRRHRDDVDEALARYEDAQLDEPYDTI
jgi:hypothetical protein